MHRKHALGHFLAGQDWPFVEVRDVQCGLQKEIYNAHKQHKVIIDVKDVHKWNNPEAIAEHFTHVNLRK